ncbi:hypothetical protein B0T44_18350 [Nocardia donostiensis]|uniref:NlpC/P60 domain-containing protein n=2 Tax=Nocardia donostiensis TaxID=1538463 RepID=A0A1V2TA15_9NOCA|nr:hypothetical protein B0T46_23460 [Nocardia donostiensis]OQS18661.1 hypothetical protein B0T44_18350 [Nocardia donostiensis]
MMFALGVLGVVCVCCLGLTSACGNVISNGIQDFQDQCDTAIGQDPAAPKPAAPDSADEPADTDEPVATSAPLTANPYAELVLDPNDDSISPYIRDCASAMKTAPHQQGMLRTVNTGIAADCAGQLALQQAGGASGSAGGAQAQADFARNVIYWASSAAVTGRCDPTVGAAAPEPSKRGCGALDPDQQPGAVVLPLGVKEQGYCGQRVAPAAVSAGDLVFWDYRAHGATRVGIAVDATQMVTVEPGGATPVRQLIPLDEQVRVKRVLSS